MKLTAHATERMRQRGVSHAEVRQVFDDPDMTWPDASSPRRRILVRTVAGRRLKLVVAAADVIVTVVVLDE